MFIVADYAALNETDKKITDPDLCQPIYLEPTSRLNPGIVLHVAIYYSYYFNAILARAK